MSLKHWNSYTISLTAAAGLGIAYIIFRKFRTKDAEHTTIVAAHTPFTTKEVTIPSASVAAFIGKGGSKIKDIQEKTDTKIRFKDSEDKESSDERVCIIRGRTVDVQYAEVVIKQFLSEQATIETLEMWIPERYCGMVIGRGGEKIKEMSKTCGARIFIERTASGDPEKVGLRKVTIRGAAEQLSYAKQLIEEVLSREQQQRQRVQEHASHRSMRRAPGADHDALVKEPDHKTESLAISETAGYIDVFLSAVISPDQFWVQMVGPKVIELDDLVTSLTEFYGCEENKLKSKIESPQVGDIVASLFRLDQSYYRARITALNPTNQMASVYFLDFGDTDDINQSELFALPTQFMTLRFQAVECRLAGVKPRNGCWSAEAVELFEELTLTAKWKPILAKIVNYITVPDKPSHVPVVELVNTQTSTDINIANELVSRGFADPSL